MTRALAVALALGGCVDQADNTLSCGGEPHFCGNGVCESDESAATCPVDCDASLTIQDATPWPVAVVYVWPCGSSDAGANQLAAPIAPAGETTVNGLTSGCYSFRAVSTDASETWESDEQQLAAIQRGWTWTLTTSDARTPS
ncbi:MAG TPA: hypothetical protein VGG28_07355 [Kofleriaceae bacterium]